MSVKMNYTYGCWIVIHNKTNSLRFIAWVITYKIVELVVKFCQANFIHFFIIFYWKCLLNWTIALRWTSAFTHEEVCEVLVVTNDKPLVHNHSGRNPMNPHLQEYTVWTEQDTVCTFSTILWHRNGRSASWKRGEDAGRKGKGKRKGTKQGRREKRSST